jgi:hypothetical protein
MQRFQEQAALMAGLQKSVHGMAAVVKQPTEKEMQQLFTDWYLIHMWAASPQTAETKPADTEPHGTNPPETVPPEPTAVPPEPTTEPTALPAGSTAEPPVDAKDPLGLLHAAEPTAVPEANHSDTPTPEPEQLILSSLTHVPGSVMLQPPISNPLSPESVMLQLESVMLQPHTSGAAADQPDQRDSERNAEPGIPRVLRVLAEGQWQEIPMPMVILTPATRNCFRAARRRPVAAMQHHHTQRHRQNRPATTESERRHIANLEQAELAAGAAASDAGWTMVSAAAAAAPASPESPVAEAAAAPATEVSDTEGTEAAPAAADTEVAPATAVEVHTAAAAPKNLE